MKTKPGIQFFWQGTRVSFNHATVDYFKDLAPKWKDNPQFCKLCEQIKINK